MHARDGRDGEATGRAGGDVGTVTYHREIFAVRDDLLDETDHFGHVADAATQEAAEMIALAYSRASGRPAHVWHRRTRHAITPTGRCATPRFNPDRWRDPCDHHDEEVAGMGLVSYTRPATPDGETATGEEAPTWVLCRDLGGYTARHADAALDSAEGRLARL